jgi:hypothetical protein
VIAIQDLAPGTRLKLKGEIVAEVVENPKDGMWLLVRRVPAPRQEEREGKEELCHADEVLEVL